MNRILIMGCFFLWSVVSVAQERVKHYEGQSVKTIPQAVHQLQETQQLIEQALVAGDLAKVHELTYSAENALQLLAQHIADTAAALEALHLASEQAKKQDSQQLGLNYLFKLNQLLAQFNTMQKAQ